MCSIFTMQLLRILYSCTIVTGHCETYILLHGTHNSDLHYHTPVYHAPTFYYMALTIRTYILLHCILLYYPRHYAIIAHFTIRAANTPVL
jgi:hypothetical protein